MKVYIAIESNDIVYEDFTGKENLGKSTYILGIFYDFFNALFFLNNIINTRLEKLKEHRGNSLLIRKLENNNLLMYETRENSEFIYSIQEEELLSEVPSEDYIKSIS